MVETENIAKTSGSGIFYIGLVLSIIRYMIPETTLYIPEMILIIKGFMFLIITIQFALAFPLYETSEKQLIILVLLLVIFIGISTQRFGVVYSMFALIVGAKGVDFKSIVKVYFLTGAILCSAVVLMSYLGLIENIGINTEGHGISETSTIRYSMGYIWPTNFATHVFFVLLAYWILKDGHMTIMRLFVFSFIAYEVYRLSDSMLGCGCIVLLILSSFLLRIRKWLVLKNSRIGKYSFIKKFLWMSYIPVLFAIMTYATYSYDSTDPNWIAADLVLSGRLSISQEALEKEGTTWFGQEYVMTGGDVDKNIYNYIDSSFLQAVVIYGIVFSILLLISYMYIVGQAYNRRDYTFLYATIVAGVSGAIAQHFLQIFMNPLWLAVTAQFLSDIKEKEILPELNAVVHTDENRLIE